MTQHLAEKTQVAFLEGAARIGAQLCRDAVWDGERCNWVGASMEPVNGQWQVVQRSFGPDIYAGTAGMALFLAELFAHTGEKPFRRAALGAMKHALSRATSMQGPALASYYVGKVGLAHALMRLAERLQDSELSEAARPFLNEVYGADLQQQGLDVLAGVAGAIPALLDIHHRTQDPQALEFAIQCGEHLLNTTSKQGESWSWGMPGEEVGTPHLTGFSHGTAGIGWALLELHHATKDERFRQAAASAFTYERQLYDPAQQNWPDLRSDPSRPNQPEKQFMLAWCHGAPGIALSRLRAAELTGDSSSREEALIAVNTTAKALRQALLQPGGSFSLCHGLAGNADILLNAAEVLNDPAWRKLAEQVGKYGLAAHSAPRIPWPCGVMGGGETPNLMLGLAGIGYFYLRLHAPERVPSVMQLPVGHAGKPLT